MSPLVLLISLVSVFGIPCQKRITIMIIVSFYFLLNYSDFRIHFQYMGIEVVRKIRLFFNLFGYFRFEKFA